MSRRLRVPCCICIFALLAAARMLADQATWEKHMEQVRSLRQKGAYAEAEKAALAAVAEAEKSDHPNVDLATTWNNLGTLYYDTGRYVDAEKQFRRSIELWEKLGDAGQLDVAQCASNLAVLYLKTGRLQEAEPMLLRVLAIREKTSVKDQRGTAESLNNLAELYRAQGRYAEAEPLYRRAIATWENSLGPEHPKTATGLNNLAALTCIPRLPHFSRT